MCVYLCLCLCEFGDPKSSCAPWITAWPLLSCALGLGLDITQYWNLHDSETHRRLKSQYCLRSDRKSDSLPLTDGILTKTCSVWNKLRSSGGVWHYRAKQCPPTFSAVLVPEVLFPCIFPKRISEQCYRPWTKITSYEVNHNIINFDLKQQMSWKLDKKTNLLFSWWLEWEKELQSQKTEMLINCIYRNSVFHIYCNVWANGFKKSIYHWWPTS